MNFMKGMLLGGLISAGVIYMFTEKEQPSKKKMIKKGKQFAKKMGML